MNHIKNNLIVLMLFSFSIFAANNEYNVKDFGANGNGKTLATNAIQRAIDKATQNGGGSVVISAGIYKIGTIILKDNVNLDIQEGVTLLGSNDIKDYSEVNQKMESRTNGLYAKYFMIFAENSKNISITGGGIINGNGLKNFQITRPQNMRPYLIRLVNCEDVTVKDVQMLEAANWTLHLLGCKNVVIDGIKIKNTTRANRDGLDIDACNNVMVSNCIIASQDDAIVLKATNDIKCENITITNCVLSSFASAIKTGTESNGGFKNITISNCVIKNIPIHTGIELMTVDGGDMENITVSNIVMENVATPIFVYLGNRARPFKKGQYVKKVAEVHDIYFDNILIRNAKFPSSVMGINNHQVKNVSFNNVSVRYSETVEGKPQAVNNIPFKDMDYPNAHMNGGRLPAFAFYNRNVVGLSFNNIRIYSAKGEIRSAIIIDRAKDIELFSVKSSSNNLTEPLAYFRNTENVYTSLCRTINKTNSLFKIEKNCTNINFNNNFLCDGQKESVNIKELDELQIYADIDPVSKLSVTNGKIIDGLEAQKLPLTVEFEFQEKVTPQVCLLIKAKSGKSEKVKIKYKGIEQEFTVDWSSWGWAPIALLKQFKENEKVKFTIEAIEKNSKLIISKVEIKNLKLGYTD